MYARNRHTARCDRRRCVVASADCGPKCFCELYFYAILSIIVGVESIARKWVIRSERSGRDVTPSSTDRTHRNRIAFKDFS